MVYHGECSFHVHLRRYILVLLDGMSWSYQWDPSHLMYHLRLVFFFFIIIFCFDDLSIGVSGVLKSPTIIVLLSISPFMSVFVLCIEVLLCWVHRYYNCYVFFLDWSLDHYVEFFMRIATPAFFCFPFAWNIFFHHLTFSPYVSLGLKWVSCRQHIYGSCFYIHSASLCLLVRAFNTFTFKVIIDIYVPIAIFLIVWG